MPMLPKRGCSEPMCGAVAAAGEARCEDHARENRKASQRLYDSQRGSRVERGYDSVHQRLRVLCFERDDWRCRGCGWEPDVVRDCRLAGIDAPPAEVVLDELRRAKVAGERHLHMDHVLPIATHPDLRLDLGNAQTLSDWCHRRKTAKENGLASLDPRQTGMAGQLPGDRPGDQMLTISATIREIEISLFT